MNPLRLRRPRLKQPLAIAPVDRNNPITQGLRAVFVGSMAYDPITGRRFADSAPNGRTMGKAGLGVDGRVAQAKLALGGPSLSTGSMFVVFETSDPTTEQIVLEAGPDGSFTAGVRGIRFIGGQISTYVRNFYDLISTGVYRTDTPIKVGTTYAGASTNLYVNGALDRSGTTADTTSLADIFNVGGITGQTAYNLRGRVSIALLWDRVVSPGEMASLAANEWQLWPAESPLAVAVTPASGAALTGAAAAVISAYGALATSIPLAGDVLERAGADGALSTSVQLAGSAKQRATAAGNLSGGGLSLAGATSMRAAALGELSTAITLAGAAQSQAGATGTLAAPGAGLAGAARAVTSLGSALSTGISLAGAGSARINGSATLRTEIVLGVVVGARASATAALRTSISLSGIASAAVMAGGKLADGSGQVLDISKISLSRISLFGGSGSRVSIFDGSGSRVAEFDGSGSRVARYQ